MSAPVIGRATLLHAKNVRETLLADMRPGDVTIEGVVLSVDAVGYHTVNEYVTVDEGQKVAVLARLDKEMLKVISAAVQTQSRRTR